MSNNVFLASFNDGFSQDRLSTGVRTLRTQSKNSDFSAFIGYKLVKKVVGWWSAHFESGRSPRKGANLGADSISFFKIILHFLTR